MDNLARVRQRRSMMGTRTTRRCCRTAAAWVLLVTVLSGASRVHATPAKAPVTFRACMWQPAADEMSFGPSLVGTVRIADGALEILHRVTCVDRAGRTVSWRWMPSSYQGAPS